jgi:hypothetical protein
MCEKEKESVANSNDQGISGAHGWNPKTSQQAKYGPFIKIKNNESVATVA